MEATSNPGPGRSASGEGKTNRAQEKADELKRVTKEKTSGLKAEVRERAEDVKEEMRGRVEEKKHVATEKVHALAHALRAAGDTLEEEGESGLARYGRQAADQVERLASYIDGNDTSGMMRQFESMARDNPAAFTGTTFAAGLLLGRFLRASRPDDTSTARRWEDRGTSSGRGDGVSDDASGFGSGTFTGGAGFGSPAETAFAGERMTDIGPTTGGMRTSGTRPSDLGDMPGSTQRAGFDEGNIGGMGYGEPGSTRTGTGADRSASSRQSGTGFETPGSSFGSGVGHATTGGGSTAGRSGIDIDENRSAQDRQRSGGRSEGGSSNG